MTVLPHQTDPLPGFEHLAPAEPTAEDRLRTLVVWISAAMKSAGDWRAVLADVEEPELEVLLDDLEGLLAVLSDELEQEVGS